MSRLITVAGLLFCIAGSFSCSLLREDAPEDLSWTLLLAAFLIPGASAGDFATPATPGSESSPAAGGESGAALQYAALKSNLDACLPVDWQVSRSIYRLYRTGCAPLSGLRSRTSAPDGTVRAQILRLMGGEYPDAAPPPELEVDLSADRLRITAPRDAFDNSLNVPLPPASDLHYPGEIPDFLVFFNEDVTRLLVEFGTGFSKLGRIIDGIFISHDYQIEGLELTYDFATSELELQMPLRVTYAMSSAYRWQYGDYSEELNPSSGSSFLPLTLRAKLTPQGDLEFQDSREPFGAAIGRVHFVEKEVIDLGFLGRREVVTNNLQLWSNVSGEATAWRGSNRVDYIVRYSIDYEAIFSLGRKRLMSGSFRGEIWF